MTALLLAIGGVLAWATFPNKATMMLFVGTMILWGAQC